MVVEQSSMVVVEQSSMVVSPESGNKDGEESSSSTPSSDMEGAKEEEKSDVYSTTMTEAMGAGKYYGSYLLEVFAVVRNLGRDAVFQTSVFDYKHSVGDMSCRLLCMGYMTPADVDKLRSIGVKTIYCLQQDPDLARVSKLHKAVNRNGGITYIHCTAGHGKSSATALAYMFWVLGYKLNNAVSLILRNRKCYLNVDAIKSATADIKIPLQYDEKHGSWTLQRDLLEGRYEYKYIVDGEWMTNTNEPVTPVNKDGHINNYVQVVDKEQSADVMLVDEVGPMYDFDLKPREQRL
ncbi:phosphoglucan phosphatase DSP4, amyloplastic [Tanacetum coccineum]